MNEGFYVSIRKGSKHALGLGTYPSEPQARAHIDLARRLADRVDPWSGFYQFGTCKLTTRGPLPTGRLNHLAHTETATPPGTVTAYRHLPPTSPPAADRSRTRTAPHETVPVAEPLYLIGLGPELYEGYRDGRPFTLLDALREVYGIGQATVYRIAPGGALVPVVANAGSTSQIVHVPTGRHIRRQPRRRHHGAAPPPAAPAAAATAGQPAQPGAAHPLPRPGHTPHVDRTPGPAAHPFRPAPPAAAHAAGDVPSPRPSSGPDAPARGR